MPSKLSLTVDTVKLITMPPYKSISVGLVTTVKAALGKVIGNEYVLEESPSYTCDVGVKLPHCLNSGDIKQIQALST